MFILDKNPHLQKTSSTTFYQNRKTYPKIHMEPQKILKNEQKEQN
jgi:hypothetical protein